MTTKQQPAPPAIASLADGHLARLRAHHNNIRRYRSLLATRLTDLERSYIERRLQEEQAAMNDLADETVLSALAAQAAPRAAA